MTQKFNCIETPQNSMKVLFFTLNFHLIPKNGNGVKVNKSLINDKRVEKHTEIKMYLN